MKYHYQDKMNKLVSEAIQYDNIIIGESSHGAHEFASMKFEIAKRLLKNISFIVVEWDWCDCYKINEYITGLTNDLDFTMSRWPQFMWQNNETLEFIHYLRKYNSKRKDKVSFFGIDIFGVDKCVRTLGFNVCRNSDNEQTISNECMNFVSSLKPSDKKLMNLNSRICSIVIKNYVNMKKKGANQWEVREKHMIEVFNILKNRYIGKSLVLCHNTHAQSTSCVDILTLSPAINNSYVIGMFGFEGKILTSKEWMGRLVNLKINKPNASSGEYKLFEKNKQIVFEDQINNIPGYRAFGAVANPDGYYFNFSLKCSFDALICFNELTPIDYVK